MQRKEGTFRRTRPAKNSRQQQSEETRRKLLEASLELFVHKGYAGTTVRDIAKAAGVSPGLMFHYFSSKEAMLLEHARVVRGGIESVVAKLNAAKDPLLTFHEIAAAILDSLRDISSRNLFLLSNQVISLDSIPAQARRAVSATKSIEASVPLVRRGQRSRQIKRGDPMALVVAYWGALQGIAEVLVWNKDAAIPGPDAVISILKA
jgi:TetR/AcrR family transcriptional regulator